MAVGDGGAQRAPEIGDRLRPGTSPEGGPARPERREELEVSKRWFVLRVQSNREEQVRENLDKLLELEDLRDRVPEILVPTEAVTELRGGKRTVVERKLFPGYVIVQIEVEEGGAIHFIDANAFAIVDCNIAFNTSVRGGGVYCVDSLTATISDSPSANIRAYRPSATAAGPGVFERSTFASRSRAWRLPFCVTPSMPIPPCLPRKSRIFTSRM